MSIFTALIVAIIAGLQLVDSYGTQIWTMNYMIWSALVGLIMGDPLTGVVIGATVQLMSLGVAAIGGSSVPNYGMAAILATAITIATQQEISVGIAVGITAGALGVQLDVLVKIFNGFLANKSRQYCEKKEFKKMENILYLGPICFFLSAAIPTFIVAVFGVAVADFIVNTLPAWFVGGLTIATGLLPVIGMGMLLTYMPTKKFFGFVAVGFVLAAYLGLSVLPVAIIGGAVAYEYFKKDIEESKRVTAVAGGDDEDE